MQHFYVGGYSAALYHCVYDKQKAITILEDYKIPNASYLCFSKDRKYIYAVIEEESGGAAAFSVESDGSLKLINKVQSGGAFPCHLSVSDSQKTLFIAHYGSGTTAAFQLNTDGGIGSLTNKIDHSKLGKPTKAYPGRQEAAHAHFVQPVKDSLYICDLGLDCVLQLDFNGNELGRFSAPSAYGARHMAFHPDNNCTYLVCEMGCAVIALNDLKGSQPVSVLNKPDPKCTSAAIRLSPDGKFLLVSNRGGDSDSISVLGLDLKLNSVVNSGGSCPRDFQFNPSGDKVFVANQDSNIIQVFNWENGKLSQDTMSLNVKRPTCVLF